MLDKLIEGISSLAPFLASYPPWVRILFSFWFLLTAVMLLAFVLARSPVASVPEDPAGRAGNGTPADGAPAEAAPVEAAPADGAPSAPAEETPTTGSIWFSLEGVELYGPLEGGKVRVTATVNGLEYTYPSLEGIEWAAVGPEMSTQQFRVPGARSGYRIRFSMLVRKDGEDVRMVSQETDTASGLPFSSEYELYEVGEEATRAPHVGAVIRYRLYR